MNRNNTGFRRFPARPGFTLMEALVVVILLGIVATIGLPNLTRSMKRTRSDRALMVIKGDMENAFALASRQGKPVKVDFNTSQLGYAVRDRSTNQLLFERRFGGETPFGAKGMWVSSATVTIFPSGYASTPYWIRFDWGDSDWRWILVRRTGQMREWGWL